MLLSGCFVCGHASRFSRVQLFLIPWTRACQALLSIRFSRQEYWSGFPWLPSGDLPNSGIKFMSVYVSCIGRWVLYQLCHLGSLVSLGPCKQRDAGLHSGNVGRDSAPFSESPFLHCSCHTPQLHWFQHLPTLSTSSGPGGDTALIFSSTGQVSQNVTTCSGKVLGGVSETSGLTLFEALQPMSADGNHLGLKRQTSDVCPPRPQKSLLFCPQISELSQVDGEFLPWLYSLSYSADSWIMHTAVSTETQSCYLHISSWDKSARI